MPQEQITVATLLISQYDQINLFMFMDKFHILSTDFPWPMHKKYEETIFEDTSWKKGSKPISRN